MGNTKIQSCFARYELKYALTQAQYEAMRRSIEPHMRPDTHPRYTISNLYYDTENFQLIRGSLDKPDYKEKLRLRSYGKVEDGDTVFLEMKKKFDGVVFKRRIVLTAREAMAYLESGERPAEKGQILREIDYMRSFYTLEPKAYIAYDREAWAGIEDSELRLTFDTNLRWRPDALDLRLDAPTSPIGEKGMILMEIKVPGAMPLWLAHLVESLGIGRVSFSKYGACFKENFLPELQKSWAAAIAKPQTYGAGIYTPFVPNRKAAYKSAV